MAKNQEKMYWNFKYNIHFFETDALQVDLDIFDIQRVVGRQMPTPTLRLCWSSEL